MIPKTERKSSKESRKQWIQWPSSLNKYRWSPYPCQTTIHGCHPRSAGSPSCVHHGGTASGSLGLHACGILEDTGGKLLFTEIRHMIIKEAVLSSQCLEQSLSWLHWMVYYVSNSCFLNDEQLWEVPVWDIRAGRQTSLAQWLGPHFPWLWVWDFSSASPDMTCEDYFPLPIFLNLNPNYHNCN